MRKNDIESIISLLDKQIDLSMQYYRLTEHMISAELETIQKTLITRSEIIEEMTMIKAKINDIIEIQTEATKNSLKTLLAGQGLSRMTIEWRQIKQKVEILQRSGRDIFNKDDIVRKHIEQQYIDVRSELEELKKDKKVIDYYHTVGPRVKGGNFDSTM